MKSKRINGHGYEEWKLPNGNLHNKDGPAIEYSNGSKHWYLNGISYTEQEYKKKMRSRKLKLLL
jgi:hypothetical protein